MKNKNDSNNDHEDHNDIDEEDIDDDDNHSGNKSIPDDTSYFYIVDMDLTSQGEMNDEISHLSDPTTGGGGGNGIGGRKHGLGIGGIGSRRRINFLPLRQPIAALRDRLLLNHNNNSSNNNTSSNIGHQHKNTRRRQNHQQHPRHPQKHQQGKQQGTLSLKHPYHNTNQKEEVLGDDDNEKENYKYHHDPVSPLTMTGAAEGSGRSRIVLGGQAPQSLYYQSLDKENYGSTSSNMASTGKTNVKEQTQVEGGGAFRNIRNIDDTTTAVARGTGPTKKVLPPYLSSSYQQLQLQLQLQQQPQYHTMSWDDNDEKLLLFDDDRTETPKSMSIDMFGGNSISSSNGDFYVKSSKVGSRFHGQQQKHTTGVSTTDPTAAVRSSIAHQGTTLEHGATKFLSNISSWYDSKKNNIHSSFDGGTSNKTSWFVNKSSRPTNGHHRSPCCSGFDSSGVIFKKRIMSSVHTSFNWILQRWASFVLVISVILFVVGCFDQAFLSSETSIQSSTSPTSIQRIIDILYWCVVSFTTIGGGLNSTTNDENIGSRDISPTMLICTMIYAFLGVTSLAVGWGHYNCLLLDRVEENQKRKQDARVDQVFNAFCNDTEKSSSSSSSGSGHPFSDESERPFSSTDKDALLTDHCQRDVKEPTKAFTVRYGKIFLVPIIVFVFAIVLGTVSGWNLLQSIYFTTITAFSMADSTIYPPTAVSKILAICIIPSCLALKIRWMSTVSNLINHPKWAAHSEKTENGPISKAEVSRLLQSAKMDDGLLTRADFIELMLLAMKKVDPDLLIELREGFERATRYGSIDMTRKEWIAKATNALDEPIRTGKKNNESVQPSDELIRNSQVASQGISAWLLGLDGPMIENTPSPTSGGNRGRFSITTVEV